MPRIHLRPLFAAILLTAAATAAAEEYPEQRKALEAAFPDLEIGEISQSAIPGLLEFKVGADVFYASEDARYFVQAEIFDIESRTNITEESRALARAAYVGEIKNNVAVEFAADEPKYTVTVFTDIDCGYCRKLHQQMSDYHARGISIRYLFFPRSGPNTASWAKAESVWCSESQQEAMTRAKAGEALPAADCQPTPIADHYKLVGELGLTGTPALFTDGGQLLVGYRSPDELEQILKNE
jgi:thiol:disulfide interchange protein DsbC